MFLFKKIAASLLAPLPICVMAVVAGLLLMRFTRLRKSGTAFIITGVATLTLLSTTPVANALIATLENQYPAYIDRHPASLPVNYVVVLGGGHVADPTIPVTSQINPATLARLSEGIRLHQQIPGSRLLLSGGTYFGIKPEAETMRAMALLLGVDARALVIDAESRDTKEQAEKVKILVGNASFLLVTSASHMPRSMALFNGQGLSPIAAPTHHTVRDDGGQLGPRYFFPNGYALRMSEQAIHEYLGITWAKLRGQF